MSASEGSQAHDYAENFEQLGHCGFGHGRGGMGLDGVRISVRLEEWAHVLIRNAARGQGGVSILIQATRQEAEKTAEHHFQYLADPRPIPSRKCTP